MANVPEREEQKKDWHGRAGDGVTHLVRSYPLHDATYLYLYGCFAYAEEVPAWVPLTCPVTCLACLGEP